MRVDEIYTKGQALRASLKAWLNQEKNNRANKWIRTQEPSPNNFFERIQNIHLIPLLFALYIVFVFILSLLA